MGSQRVRHNWSNSIHTRMVFLLSHMPQFIFKKGFPGSSAGKASACNSGDPGSIPGSRRSSGEGTGHPLQDSWAFLVAQMVKNLPAIRERWVQSLGWEDPLEKGTATHSSFLSWRIPLTDYSPWGLKESDTTERLFTFSMLFTIIYF